MTDYPFTAWVIIDGIRMPCTAVDLGKGLPTVLDGLSFSWGRSSTVDQPDTETCNFTIQEQLLTARPESVVARNIYLDPSHEYGLLPFTGTPPIIGSNSGQVSLDTTRKRTGKQSLKYLANAHTVTINRAVVPNPTGSGSGWATANAASFTATRVSDVIRRPGTWSSQEQTILAGGANIGSWQYVGLTANTVAGAIPITPGATYTYSIWWRANVANVRPQARMGFWNAANTLVGSVMQGPITTPVVAANAWTRLTWTFTAPTDPTITNARPWCVLVQPSGRTGLLTDLAWITDFQLEDGSTATTYFDGSMTSDATTTYAWNGTPNASSSTRTGPATVPTMITQPSLGTPASFGMAAGDSVTVSAWVWIPTGVTPYTSGGQVLILGLDGTALAGPVAITAPTARDQWVQVFATVPITYAAGTLQVVLYGPMTTGQVINFDDLGVAPGNSPQDFSGDTPSVEPFTIRYRWTGTPGNSTSEKYVPAEGVDTWDFLHVGSDVEVWTAGPAPTSRTALVWSGQVTSVQAQAVGDYAFTAAVTASDISAALANLKVGDQPWPVETVAARANRIVALVPTMPAITVDDGLQDIQVSRRDVDAQPPLGLLQDLAQTAGGVMWITSHAAGGVYLWMEDIDGRAAIRKFVIGSDGAVTIDGIGPDEEVAVISARDVLRDPYTWTQDVSQVITQISVGWLEQTTEDGQPSTADHTEIVQATQPDLDRYGVRDLSVSTELITGTDAANLAARLLAQSENTGWIAAGLQLDTAALLRDIPEPDDPHRLTVVLDLLDATERIGKAVTLIEMPPWTPQDAVSSVYVEGGTYTWEDQRWQLELTASPAAGQGESARWVDFSDTNARWMDFADTITWLDAYGTAGPLATM